VQKVVKEYKIDTKKETQSTARNYLHDKVTRIEWIDPQAFLQNFEHISKLKNSKRTPTKS
jgi:hypothetical protein